MKVKIPDQDICEEIQVSEEEDEGETTGTYDPNLDRKKAETNYAVRSDEYYC